MVDPAQSEVASTSVLQAVEATMSPSVESAREGGTSEGRSRSPKSWEKDEGCVRVSKEGGMGVSVCGSPGGAVLSGVQLSVSGKLEGRDSVFISPPMGTPKPGGDVTSMTDSLMLSWTLETLEFSISFPSDTGVYVAGVVSWLASRDTCILGVVVLYSSALVVSRGSPVLWEMVVDTRAVSGWGVVTSVGVFSADVLGWVAEAVGLAVEVPYRCLLGLLPCFLRGAPLVTGSTCLGTPTVLSPQEVGTSEPSTRPGVLAPGT